MVIYENRHWIVDQDGVKQRSPIDDNLYVSYETIFDLLGSEPTHYTNGPYT
jgi:hypothetical protein